jgi:hypothetical protein
LQKAYGDVFGEPSRSSHKQYLFRRIAWQLQARVEGGLSAESLRRAAEIADDADLRLGGPKGFWSWPEQTKPKQQRPPAQSYRDGRLPQPGAVLIRRHQGRDVVVKVLEGGFEYKSRHYRSLSAIAREVTGRRWNGLLFFGLTERRHG